MEDKNSDVEALVLELGKLKDNSETVDNIVSILKKMHTSGVKLEKYINTILAKLANDQYGDNLAKLLTELDQAGIMDNKLVEHVPTILAKLANFSAGYDVAELVEALKKAGITDEKLEKYVPTILVKLDDNQYVFNLVKLLMALKKANVQLTENRIDMILAKLANDQSGWVLADLTTTLNQVGIKGKKLEKHVSTILKNLNVKRYGADLANLLTELNKADVQLTENHVDTILNKLSHPSSVDDLLELVKTLHQAGVQFNMILRKLSNYDMSVVGKIELVIMLKRNNSGVKLPDCLIPFWDESLLENEFFKNQKDNKKEENLNNDLTVKSKENDEISASSKKVVQNSHNNSDQEKSILALAVIKYLENRLENLQLHNLDAEKQSWEDVVADLLVKKIITDKHKNEFYNKLNSVCSVVVSAILWIGCVLLVPITLLFALKSDEIEDRISHPTNRRVFERLKECKNDLFSPLKMVPNANQKNNNMDR